MSTRTSATTVADIPELAAAWDYDSNLDSDPSALKPGSHRTAMWMCADHGGYERRIDLQAKRVSCPFCLPAKAESSIAESHPALASELDAAGNHPRRAEDIPTNSVCSVRWICQEHGSYELAPIKRTMGPGGCPQCPKGSANPLKETTLAATRPDIASAWSASLNGDLTPKDVSMLSNRVVWWDCEEGHPPYQQSVLRRSRKSGCPGCADLTKKSFGSEYPDLAAEWSTLLNGDLSPWDVSPAAEIKPWWVCLEGHRPYRARLANRSYHRSGCPECGVAKVTAANSMPAPGKSLADRFPELVGAWDITANGFSADRVFAFSEATGFWTCSCGQGFERRIADVAKFGEARCPLCSEAARAASRAIPQSGRSVAEMFPELALDWDYKRNGSLTPADVAVMSKRPVYWSCSCCLARTLQPPVNRTRRFRRGAALPPASARPVEGRRCPRCCHTAGTDNVDSASARMAS